MNTAISSSTLQIWDNAAFVDDSSAGPGLLAPHSHLPLQPISLNIADDDPIKENRSPRSNKAAAAAGNIDAEIAEIESEISRLSKKLEALKIKKAQILVGATKTTRTPGPAAKRGGRIVPAKFLTNLETPPPPASKKIPIQESRRRGLSLGPMEIYNNATPLRSQKPPASFQRLEGIKEKEKEKPKAKDSTISVRRRGMSLGPSEILRQRSSSPKARKPMNSRVSELRKGVSTVGAKKPAAKMDEASASGIKPKTLFQEKKRPATKVRIVASRYNESGSKRRKWSLPEAERSGVEGKKQRAFSLGGANVARLMKVEEEEEERSSPPSIMKIAKGLPKIRTSRGEAAAESPRDSGAAKRVSELVGRRSCFADDGSGSSCQSLKFDEDEDGDDE